MNTNNLFKYFIKNLVDLSFYKIPLYYIPIAISFYFGPKESLIIGTSIWLYKSINFNSKNDSDSDSEIIQLDSDNETCDTFDFSTQLPIDFDSVYDFESNQDNLNKNEYLLENNEDSTLSDEDSSENSTSLDEELKISNEKTSDQELRSLNEDSSENSTSLDEELKLPNEMPLDLKLRSLNEDSSGNSTSLDEELKLPNENLPEEELTKSEKLISLEVDSISPKSLDSLDNISQNVLISENDNEDDISSDDENYIINDNQVDDQEQKYMGILSYIFGFKPKFD